MTTATAPLAIDRRALMLEAWAIVHRRMSKGELFVGLLSKALSSAWYTAKMNARVAAKSAASRAAAEKLAEQSTAELVAQITALQNKDVLGHDGMASLMELKKALETAKDREASKRDLITAAAGRIIAVTFTKKDGTARTMQVQPAAMAKRVKGDAATDAGKRATLTRKATHPNLLPVWDVEAKAARSINLATVTRIATGGHVHTF